MPSVLRPGNELAPTGMDENPVLVESPEALMPENTKSSTVTRDAFLQETKRGERSGRGMQKSWRGSESEDETRHVCRRRTRNGSVAFDIIFSLRCLCKKMENKDWFWIVTLRLYS